MATPSGFLSPDPKSTNPQPDATQATPLPLASPPPGAVADDGVTPVKMLANTLVALGGQGTTTPAAGPRPNTPIHPTRRRRRIQRPGKYTPGTHSKPTPGPNSTSKAKAAGAASRRAAARGRAAAARGKFGDGVKRKLDQPGAAGVGRGSPADGGKSPLLWANSLKRRRTESAPRGRAPRAAADGEGSEMSGLDLLLRASLASTQNRGGRRGGGSAVHDDADSDGKTPAAAPKGPRHGRKRGPGGGGSDLAARGLTRARTGSTGRGGRRGGHGPRGEGGTPRMSQGDNLHDLLMGGEGFRGVSPSYSSPPGSEDGTMPPMSGSRVREVLGNATAKVASLAPSAATAAASRWLDVLAADTKGRLATLRRSRQRVQRTRASLDAGPGDALAQGAEGLFREMDAALAGEGAKLERWLRQVEEMRALCNAAKAEEMLEGRKGRKGIASMVAGMALAPGVSPAQAATAASAAAIFTTAVDAATRGGGGADGGAGGAGFCAPGGGGFPPPGVPIGSW